MGCILPDYEQGLSDFRRRGVEIRCEGLMGEMRFAFADATAEFGCMLELFERNDSLARVLQGVRAAHEQWDGKDLIRSFSSLF
ncbi:MAG: hypothetical protein ABW110_13935 [Steroidobacteraceae bacterium]